MTTRPSPDMLGDSLLCYCTNVTIAELREACRSGRWPLPGKEQTGRLCTGCAGDLLYCLRRFETEPRPAPSSATGGAGY